MDLKVISLTRAVFFCLLVISLAVVLALENMELFIFLAQERKEKGIAAILNFVGEDGSMNTLAPNNENIFFS